MIEEFCFLGKVICPNRIILFYGILTQFTQAQGCWRKKDVVLCRAAAQW